MKINDPIVTGFKLVGRDELIGKVFSVDAVTADGNVFIAAFADLDDAEDYAIEQTKRLADREPPKPRGLDVSRGEETARITGWQNFNEHSAIGAVYVPTDLRSMQALRGMLAWLIWIQEHFDAANQARAVSKAVKVAIVICAAMLFSFAPARAQTRRAYIVPRPAPYRPLVMQRRRDGTYRRFPLPGTIGTIYNLWQLARPHNDVLGFENYHARYDGDFTRACHAPWLRTRRDHFYFDALPYNYAGVTVNFAGHYVLQQFGCGTDCVTGAAVDSYTGEIFWLPFTVTRWAPDWPFSYRPNSRLLIACGALVGDHSTTRRGCYQYVFNPERAR